MSIPVISSTQSVLGYSQWEYFEFQPFALNEPIRWTANNSLPAGLALDDPPKEVITGVDSTDLISCTGNFSDGDQIVIWKKSGGSSLAINTIYFVRDSTPNTSFKLSTTLNGSVLDLGSDITDGEISLKPTGRISGSAQVPGVWIIGLTAHNSDGASVEQEFTIGIEPGALVPDSLPWIAVNVFTGQLLADGEEVPPLSSEIREEMKNGKVPPYALAVKENDDLLMRVSFVRGETVQDISLSNLRMVLKEFEPDQEIAISSQNFEKQGMGTGTNFLLHSKFDGNAIKSALSNYEQDFGTYFYALAEIEYTQINLESIGPSDLIRSSATFCIRIERDIAQ